MVGGEINAALIIKYTVANYVIEENWFNGGGYTLYCSDDAPAGVYVRNNRFGRDYHPENWIVTGDCAEWTGNIWDDTELPAPPQKP